MKASLLGIVAAMLALLSPAGAEEGTPESGRALYLKYCASCHGVDGRAGTALARLFAKEPPDLTRVAERRGGWFPEVLVQEIVDGRLAAHGAREMPVWGETLSREQLRLVAEHLLGLQQPPAATGR
jgi:mono/diheme cytochrome c family protein